MLQTFCGRYSLKTGAFMFGIFFTVNSMVHLFVGFFFFISKTRFYKDEIPLGLAAGSLAVGTAQMFANVALVEGVMKRSRCRLAVWEVTHSLLLAAYAAAAAALWATLLDTAQFPVLRRLCPQVVATMLVLLSVHGALQVYALIVVESLRRKFLLESPPPSMDVAYKRLERD
ncbi:uncharacterized protein LOC124612810 [Schistocerca americana]|uniref:uncharacterized protein LOC124612810 n=1 Tax=Schistocerca americana TaxID=7009 RepID=UPI001F4FF487|nr:uncharacterized protein LOC124612810 [Schistocerca americana]